MRPDPASAARLYEYVVRRILEWTGDAARDSGYGELPDQEEDEILRRPVAFDPRFDLEPYGGPLLVDLLEEDFLREGIRPDFRRRLAELGLEAALVDAETVGDYLTVLARTLPA
jgi:hypothetical protein